MPSFSTNLRFVKPVTGEFPDTWGTEVNNGITELVDSAIAGYASIAMMDADYTLTSANGAADQARTMMLNMTGVLSANRNVICPPGFTKLYFIKNATTGGSGYAITLKYSSGSGVSIPNGRSMVLMCDGTNVREAVDYSGTGNFTNISYTGTLTGGTGVVNLGSGQFYKDASGSVGIGTASPSQRLEVSGTSPVTRISGLAGSAPRLELSSTGVVNWGLRSNSASASEFTIFQDSTERMRIDSSGNVGIGASPTVRLDVVQASGDGGMQYRSSTRTVGMGQTSGEASVYWGSGTALTFFSGSERMRIGSSGNVGIGRTSPTVKLDVNGALALSVPTFVSAGTYTVLVSDSCVRFSATCTVTLPAAASFPGRILRIANIGAVAITSASSNVGQQTTGAAGTAILPATAGKWADLHSDGSFWYMTASN